MDFKGWKTRRKLAAAAMLLLDTKQDHLVNRTNSTNLCSFKVKPGWWPMFFLVFQSYKWTLRLYGQLHMKTSHTRIVLCSWIQQSYLDEYLLYTYFYNANSNSLLSMRCQKLWKTLFYWILTVFWSKCYNYLQFYEQEVKYIAQSDITNKWRSQDLGPCLRSTKDHALIISL